MHRVTGGCRGTGLHVLYLAPDPFLSKKHTAHSNLTDVWSSISMFFLLLFFSIRLLALFGSVYRFQETGLESARANVSPMDLAYQ